MTDTSPCLCCERNEPCEVGPTGARACVCCMGTGVVEGSDAFDTSLGPAAQYRDDDERRQRENEPINALPLVVRVFVLMSHHKYEADELIGVYRTVEDAKADANRGVCGNTQTIHECTGGRQMKQVAIRIQSSDAPYPYGLWL